MTILLSMTFVPVTLSAGYDAVPLSADAAGPAETTRLLTDRPGAIKAMDKSKLSAPEKRQLHKEARSVKKQLKILSGGVCLSVWVIDHHYSVADLFALNN